MTKTTRTLSYMNLAAAVAFAGLVVAPTLAQTVVLTPAADTSIFKNNSAPTDLLSSGAGDAIYTGHTSGQVDILQRGLVRFDLSSIPCGSVITSVELSMTLLRAGGGGTPSPVSLFRLTSSWGEGSSVAFGGSGGVSGDGDCNWVERLHPGLNWLAPGGDFADTASATTPVGVASSVVWGSTAEMIADVNLWISDGSHNFGWILVSDEASFGTARKLASREAAVASTRPSLRITYTPPCLADLPLAESGCPDGVVDGSDFITFINSFSVGDLNVDAAADVNHDGVIDGSDYIAFINAFSAGC